MRTEQIDALRDHRIVFILRTKTSDHLADLVRTIWKAGGRFVEITLNTPGALDVLASLRDDAPPRCYLGAGTVCNTDDARNAAHAGVNFIVTPVASQELVTEIKERDMMGIIGAATPTEVYNAHDWGADFVKVFPVQSPDYLKTLRGPLQHIPLIAVGGIRRENAIKYINAGATAVAAGTGLLAIESDGSFDPDEVQATVRALTRVCSLIQNP